MSNDKTELTNKSNRLKVFDVEYDKKTGGYYRYKEVYKCRLCNYQTWSFYEAWKHAEKHRRDILECVMEEEE